MTPSTWALVVIVVILGVIKWVRRALRNGTYYPSVKRPTYDIATQAVSVCGKRKKIITRRVTTETEQ